MNIIYAAKLIAEAEAELSPMTPSDREAFDAPEDARIAYLEEHAVIIGTTPEGPVATIVNEHDEEYRLSLDQIC